MKNQSHKEEPEKTESKPVGYGSSIQTDGYGNRNRPPHESDAKPQDAARVTVEKDDKNKSNQ